MAYLGQLDPPRLACPEGLEGGVTVHAVLRLHLRVGGTVDPSKFNSPLENLRRLLERWSHELALLAPRSVEPDDEQRVRLGQSLTQAL
eukprot:scaffold177215_cov27-Tisochrysis_lutea.AAC.1